MFVRSIPEILGTERDVHGKGWKSRRLILAGDGLKYSVHETTIEANAVLRFKYQRHRETVYCIDGRASIENHATGVVREIEPGTIYSVEPGDDHIVRTTSEVKFLCIFDPPLAGKEEAD